MSEKKLTRDDLIEPYAALIRFQELTGRRVRVAGLNRLILDRWSSHALDYIKTEAWNRVCEDTAK